MFPAPLETNKSGTSCNDTMFCNAFMLKTFKCKNSAWGKQTDGGQTLKQKGPAKRKKKQLVTKKNSVNMI